MKSTKRDSKQNRFISPRRILSGPRAKEYRQQLVLQSHKPSKSAFYKTSKYILAIEESRIGDSQREKLREEYRILAGTEENSLFSFFVLIHLCGFRLYGTAGEANNAAATSLTRYFTRNFSRAFPEVTEIQNFIKFYGFLNKGSRKAEENKRQLKEKLIRNYVSSFPILKGDKKGKPPLYKIIKNCVLIIARGGIYRESDDHNKQRVAAFDAAWQKVQPESHKE